MTEKSGFKPLFRNEDAEKSIITPEKDPNSIISAEKIQLATGQGYRAEAPCLNRYNK
jgi:hypothetical protein